MDTTGLLRILGRPAAEAHALFRCGSRVYGTATATSDEDFVAVLARRDAKQDLLFRDGVNVVIHGLDTFRDALAGQSVFALECLFLAPEHRLLESKPAFTFKLDRAKLAASATARSTSDFKKAARQLEDEPLASKKKLFHALRVPMFALQIARSGRIVDYGQANLYSAAIRDHESTDWEDYERLYAPVRDDLLKELAALDSRKR
jgi:predicted nucleotidyltransferase